MLVLSRSSGEVINIGSDITVTVVSVGRGRVRIGIEAPQQVRVLRQELTVKDRSERPSDKPGKSLPVRVRQTRSFDDGSIERSWPLQRAQANCTLVES